MEILTQHLLIWMTVELVFHHFESEAVGGLEIFRVKTGEGEEYF